MIWQIKDTIRRTQDGGIVTVKWRVYKAEAHISPDGQEQIVRGMRSGTSSFQPSPQSESFIPYENVSKQDVISWLEAEEDVAEIEAKIDASIQMQKNQIDSYANGTPWKQ